MAWIILIIAGLFEIVWAYFMKQSHGFTRPLPTVITFITMFISFGLLSVSMKTLPLGTAYAVWTGIGALGAFLVGIVFLDETAGALRIGAAALIVSGLALMKIATPS
jgi:quaternary ammonium compound-resistance protein SugE